MQLALLQQKQIPFDISEDEINIKDYYHNDNEKLPKDEVENKYGKFVFQNSRIIKVMNNLI
jgi:hypothetical protein